jgi:hypothetical protein
MIRTSFIRCLILVFLLLPLMAVAQKQVAIKFNITSPIARTFNVAGEWAFHPRVSAQILYFKTADFTFRNNVFSGSGFTPEVRFHLKKERLKGFYAGPYLRFRYLKWDIPTKNASANFNSVTGGFIVGYQAVVKNLVTFDFFIGPSFGNHSIKVTAGVIEDFKLTTLTSAGVRSGIAIGFAIF